MTATTETGPRIAALDSVRGVAVMGILAMNIVAFAMPFQAYMNPAAYGLRGDADLAAWAFSFVFIDGKMRGLFSFLFGASTLLVIERAEAAGASAASVHYRRMAWLLVFGLLHFYLIWFGDILTAYALIGMLLYFFRDLSPRALITWGVALVLVQFTLFGSFGIGTWFMAQQAAAPGASAETLRQWADMQRQFGPLTGQALATDMALHGGSWANLVHNRFAVRGTEPFVNLFFFGWETLAYMLFGMAALKSGFFRGDWDMVRYRRIALYAFAATIPVYAALAWLLWRGNFDLSLVIGLVLGATVPFRPVMVVAYAALIILLTRNGGALTRRIAAAGRVAFTNYLGTSILMTSLFYGYGIGLYGEISRAELYLVVAAMWALMLLWSKPWLDDHLYGPFEWLWRSLARWELQPMRRG